MIYNIENEMRQKNDKSRPDHFGDVLGINMCK